MHVPKDWKSIPATLKNMGQNLFEAPNVAGWDDHLAWLATDKLAARLEWLKMIATQTCTNKKNHTCVENSMESMMQQLETSPPEIENIEQSPHTNKHYYPTANTVYLESISYTAGTKKLNSKITFALINFTYMQKNWSNFNFSLRSLGKGYAVEIDNYNLSLIHISEPTRPY